MAKDYQIPAFAARDGAGLDGVYAPQPEPATPDGLVAVTRVEAWSIFAWWDRSVDARARSNSALLIESPSIDVVSALYVLRVTFPTVSTRQPVPLRPALGGCERLEHREDRLLDVIEKNAAAYERLAVTLEHLGGHVATR